MDLIECADRGRQRVQRDRLFDGLPVLLQNALDHQFIAGDAVPVQRRALRRQVAHMTGMHAHVVDKTGHLDNAAGRQIGDQPGVDHIAVETERFVALDGVEDARYVLRAALDRKRRIAEGLLFQLFDLRGLAPDVAVSPRRELHFPARRPRLFE